MRRGSAPARCSTFAEEVRRALEPPPQDDGGRRGVASSRMARLASIKRDNSLACGHRVRHMPSVTARASAVCVGFALLTLGLLGRGVSFSEASGPLTLPTAANIEAREGPATAGLGASQRATASLEDDDAAARNEHVVWNAACWLVGLGLLAAGRRSAIAPSGARAVARVSHAGLAFSAASSRSYRR
jgi:hypothetical protein